MGYTSEEQLLNEGRKIMHLPDLKVDCTAACAPVIRSHSVSMVVRTEKRSRGGGAALSPPLPE